MVGCWLSQQNVDLLDVMCLTLFESGGCCGGGGGGDGGGYLAQPLSMAKFDLLYAKANHFLCGRSARGQPADGQ